ncbi:MAG: hypothetical protein K8S27_16650 [Candidatus Omnitrophica bacterium]|nr:hypothetical protein [Candidatus Omnitrophota bacterium]
MGFIFRTTHVVRAQHYGAEKTDLFAKKTRKWKGIKTTRRLKSKNSDEDIVLPGKRNWNRNEKAKIVPIAFSGFKA